MRRILTGLLLFLPLFAFAQFRPSYGALEDSEAVTAMKEHVSFLSSAALEGRKAGSEGEREAAAYLSEVLSSYGLEVLSGSDGDPFGLKQDNGDTLTSRNVLLVDDALDKAVDAYAKAAELDPKGTKTKELAAALKSINEKYTDEGYNAYSLGNLGKASLLFEKAVKAAGTAPLSQLDTNSVYNAGLTAWHNLDFTRAQKFFEDCLSYKYYGNDGETYAKLADIADRLGDKATSKKYLTEGSQMFPESQSLLIGLINYYISSGEDTAQLFDLFAEAQKNEPDNASLFYVEGNARKKLGQNEEALVAYDKATKVNPNYEWGYIGKGIQLYDMAVDLQDKASQEMDDAKYMALMGEFEKCLKGCIEPFEKAFEIVKDEEIKVNIAEYLKNACFRFRGESEEFQAKYDKYNSYVAK